MIAYHAGLPLFSGGFAGVDVFFVISGYLITGILHDDMAAGTFSLARFYERRARRILPALFLACLFSLFLAIALFMPADLTSFGKSLEGVAGFISNFIFARNTGYFAETLTTKPLLHTWSLAVEEQFYIAVPLLLAALARLGRRPLPVLAVLAFLSFALSIAFVSASPEKTFYLLHARAWELLAGALLRLWGQDLPLSRTRREALGGIGFALLAACYFLYDRDTLFPGGAALLPVAGAACLIWSGLAGPTLTSRLLSARPLVLTGIVSYGLYLYHWPVLVFAHYALNRAPGSMEIPLLLLLTAGLAALSYVFVERPVRAGTMLAGRRRLFFASFSGLALLALAGVALVRAEGLPGRLPAEARQYAEGQRDTNWRWTACAPKSPAAVEAGNLCAIGPKTDHPDFFVWGDSHLGALEPAIAALAEKQGKQGWAVVSSGCPPLVDTERVDGHVDISCAALSRAVMKVLRKKKIRKVLLVARWDMYADGWERDSVETVRAPEIAHPGPEGRELRKHDAFAAAFNDTVAALHTLGADVWVMRQVPPHREDIATALARAAYFGRPAESLYRPVGEIRARNAFVNAVFTAARGVSTIDPLPVFCPKDTPCRVDWQGRALYSDNDHLTVTGALWAKDMLKPFFRSF